MYTEYVKNFDDAMNLINCWYAKLPRFAAIMDEIHVSIRILCFSIPTETTSRR